MKVYVNDDDVTMVAETEEDKNAIEKLILRQDTLRFNGAGGHTAFFKRKKTKTKWEKAHARRERARTGYARVSSNIGKY